MDKTHAATAVDQTINYENKKGNNRRMNGKIKKNNIKNGAELFYCGFNVVPL